MIKKSLVGVVAFTMVTSVGVAQVSAANVTVKKGDTLYSIAKNNKLTVDELKNMNGLTSNLIYVGQVLKTSNGTTSETPSSSTVYTVKKGDTLWGISRTYQVSVDNLKKWNNLNSNLLRVGQQLKINGNSPAPTPTPESKPEENNTSVYKVQKGDTLWSIAKKYNLSVDQLKSMNGLTSNIIHIGQDLKLVKSAVMFVHPAEGSRITSQFGYRTHPTTGERQSYHSGVDFAKSGSVPILAAADGKVRISKYSTGSYGEYIVLTHTINGKTYETLYAHMKMNSRTVSQGQTVKQGQVIGYMGSTGNSTGQHLHFEIHDGTWNSSRTNAINPLPFLQ